MKDQPDLKKFLSKRYRDGYMQTQVRGGIAYQMQALRRKLGLSQAEMADRLGKPQSTISRLESTEYGKVSVQTLLDVASSLDIALLVRFVSYPEFLTRTQDMSDEALSVDTVQESQRKTEQAQLASQFQAHLSSEWRPLSRDLASGGLLSTAPMQSAAAALAEFNQHETSGQLGSLSKGGLGSQQSEGLAA